MGDTMQSLGTLSDEDLQRLASVPVVQPPAGITPNFDNPPNRIALQVWTTSTFVAIAMVFYINRLYVKTRLMKNWSWDDATLFATVILAIAQYGVMTDGVTKAFMGRHMWDISLTQMLGSRLPPIAYAIITITPWTLLFLKMTFFLLYLHLFSRIRWVRICSWIGICYVILSNGIVGIYTFVVANPHENLSWTSKATRLGVPVAILSLIADIAIFILPFAAIIPLQISHTRRIGALSIFLVGGSAIICSILNIYYRWQLQHSYDPMWDGVLGSIFALCEVMLGITCACLPAAAYGFRHEGSLYHRVLHPSHYNASKQYNSTAYTPTPRQRSEALNTESLNSRIGIRSTTLVEVSSSEEWDPNGKKKPSSFEESEEGQSYRSVELTTLEPAHLSASDAVRRMV